MNAHRSRYLFGCCSLTTTDPDDGWRAMKTIRPGAMLHDEIMLPARSGYSCGSPEREHDPGLGGALPLPKLFQTYMKLGAKVISEPAIDREFGTVDCLILMDSSVVTLSSLDVVR
jgi:putative hemolysin